MTTKNPVFEKTYKDYIAQVAEIDIESIAQKLGVHAEGNDATIPLFGKHHKVSEIGITDPSGKQPYLDICVILCKYLLLCPEVNPKEKEWVSFRDLKDSGPLTVYFANDVERAIAGHFAGRLDDMKGACKTLGGYPPDIEVVYDLAMQFNALPRVPVMLLFNDADDEFPAKSSVLFERRAEKYLDAECLAMVGRLVCIYLKKAVSSNQ
ncbi:MAG: DUF3786 domain-containing protein [Deltaproteobacteria bacterium]|nr:DUF3786 domain-containing protein [Deltaproteobacteria bacterium]MBW2119749.1 DUF3786 domain-containing protein [Deltaproteobacteria bacterium]MBW2346132.1 DUF3786 domain-containing protein [Deltaproteobacteria bacterium]